MLRRGRVWARAAQAVLLSALAGAYANVASLCRGFFQGVCVGGGGRWAGLPQELHACTTAEPAPIPHAGQTNKACMLYLLRVEDFRRHTII